MFERCDKCGGLVRGNPRDYDIAWCSCGKKVQRKFNREFADTNRSKNETYDEDVSLRRLL